MKLNLLLLFIFCSFSVFGQQQINTLTTKDLTINGKYETNSTTESSRPCPSMTTIQRDAIASPDSGSCVYNTTNEFFEIFDGTIWRSSPSEITDVNNISISGDIALTGSQFNNSKVGQLLAYSGSTGVAGGSVLSIDTPVTWNASALNLTFANNVSVSNTPSLKTIDCPALTAQSVTNIAVADTTYILIDDTCAVTQQTSVPTPQERRVRAFIGRINHPSRSSIQSVFSSPDYVVDIVSQYYDLIDAVGPFNVSGNEITPNGANLSINRSSGVIFRRASNYTTDDQNPHMKTFNSVTLANIFRSTQSAIGTGLTLTLDVANYDVGGTVTAIGGVAGRSTNQRIYLLASGNLAAQYGQVVYSSLANAVAGVPNEAFTINPNIANSGVLVGVVSCRRDATAANNTSQCVFSKVSRFDSSGVSVGSNSVATLQSAYDNSATPQITTSTSGGSVDIKRGSAADTDNVLRIQDGAGSTVFSVTGQGNATLEGDITAKNLNVLSNVLSDPGVEYSTTLWSAYADAAGTQPVDGTGGSPTVTVSNDNASPLNGTRSLVMVKTAVNSQGQGISIPFTIPTSSKYKVNRLDFDYAIVSGTYADDDVQAFVYDVTNAKVIPFQPSKLKNHAMPSERFLPSGEFQASDSTSYRLILHIASTSASAYTLKFDNFKLGVFDRSYGVVGDTNYSSKISSAGAVNALNITGWISNCSISSGGVYACPVNLSLSNKMNCQAIINTTGTNVNTVNYDYVNSTPSLVVFTINTPASTLTTNEFNIECQKTGSDYERAKSSRIMSSDAATSVVNFVGTQSSQSVTANVTDISFTSVNDTTGSWNGTQFTVKVSGDYNVGISGSINASASAFTVYVDGIAVPNTFTSSTYAANALIAGAFQIPNLKAGQKISIRINSGTSVGNGYLSISRIAGPQAIAASDTVAALYTGEPPTGTIGVSYNTVNFGTKVKDSHNAYSGGSYTVPQNGVYDISAGVRIAGTHALNSATGVAIYIDGVFSYQNLQIAGGAVSELSPHVSVNSIPLKAGQVVTVRAYSQSTTPTYIASGPSNFFSIVKSGNY